MKIFKINWNLGLATLFYLIVTLIFLRGVIFSPGILMGGDWGFPLTQSQMQRYAQSGFYTWTDKELFGAENFFLNALPVHLLIGILAKIGITGDIYTKFLLVSAFILPALGMYSLCKYLKFNKSAAVFGGFLYMTLPFVFNYAVMGWLYVLITMGILPFALITFIKSVRENNMSYSLLTGVLYSLGMVQSQSFIWYPLVFLSFGFYLVKNKKTFFLFLRSLMIILVTFIILNAYWLLPIFLNERGGILSTNLAVSSSSLGTWVRLYPLNILRVWGSLFNEPYEISIYNGLIILAFFLPLVAYSSLYFFKKNSLVNSLTLLSLITVILWALGPNVIVKLPFSDLIRDTSRFLVISSFSSVILATFVINALIENKSKRSKILAIVLCLLLVVNTYPFWVGELYAKPVIGYDFRLRTYEVPKEYIELDKELKQDSVDAKALFLPIVGELSVIDDDRFNGTYKGIRDIAASYSPKPGIVGLSDRLRGLSASFLPNLEEQTNTQKFDYMPNLLAVMNIKYIIARKDLTHPLNTVRGYTSGYNIANSLKKDKNLTLLKEGKRIVIFENKSFLPHIFIPENIIISKNGQDFSAILKKNNSKLSVGIYSNLDRLYLTNELKRPSLEHRKINPTKYEITIKKASGKFPLIFSEMYNQNWKVYLKSWENNKENLVSWFELPLPENMHFLTNGYANSWLIDSVKLCKTKLCYLNNDGSYNMRLTIEFEPQKFFYAGSLISLSGIGMILVYILVTNLNILNAKRKTT